MRKYLYRGKRKDNGEWIIGHLIWYEDGRARITPRHIDIYCLEEDENVIQHIAYEVIPETVGEYTGKMDRSGTKIFEGDVIAYDNNRYSYIVRWDEERCGFYAKMREFDDYDYLGNFWSRLSEVIGNIYDNPELLNN